MTSNENTSSPPVRMINGLWALGWAILILCAIAGLEMDVTVRRVPHIFWLWLLDYRSHAAAMILVPGSIVGWTVVIHRF